MKITPVSGDMLLKIRLLVLVGGVGFYIAKKGLAAVLAWPGEMVDKAVAAAKEGGATWQTCTVENDPYTQILTGQKYKDPLVNNNGMDFGQLSG